MNGRVSFHFQRIANQPQSRIELALSGARWSPELDIHLSDPAFGWGLLFWCD
jgi:hypothetical protein